jgi:hypothetical protein
MSVVPPLWLTHQVVDGRVGPSRSGKAMRYVAKSLLTLTVVGSAAMMLRRYSLRIQRRPLADGARKGESSWVMTKWFELLGLDPTLWSGRRSRYD